MSDSVAVMVAPGTAETAGARPLATTAGTLIRMEGVTKTYDAGEIAVHALQGIDLQIEGGQMVAIIGDSANVGSIALHARHGFVVAGCLRSVGFKHGRWLDSVLMDRWLGEGDRSLPQERPISPVR